MSGGGTAGEAPRRRRWSIRARTALVFGTVSAALTVGVLVFVAVMTQRGIGAAFSTGDTRPSLVPDPSVSAADRAAEDRTAVVSVVADQQWLWSIVGIAVAAVVATAAGWVLSTRLLRPVSAITATARRISATTLHERIALDGPDDELRRLADTVDDLFARLETAFEAQRRFVAHASHELRTPIAMQRAALQIDLHDDLSGRELREVRARLLDANRRSEHLVEGLLRLAEAERGLVAQGAVDLGAVVVAAFSDVARRAAEAGVVLSRTLDGPRSLRGDVLLVEQLMRNLVDNAVEYNVEGGSVVVSSGPTWFAVTNTGRELHPDLAQTLVRPFARGGLTPDGTTTGRQHSGLGLSIVDAVAAAHGWTCTLAVMPGGGLTVRIGDVSSM